MALSVMQRPCTRTFATRARQPPLMAFGIKSPFKHMIRQQIKERHERQAARAAAAANPLLPISKVEAEDLKHSRFPPHLPTPVFNVNNLRKAALQADPNLNIPTLSRPRDTKPPLPIRSGRIIPQTPKPLGYTILHKIFLHEVFNSILAHRVYFLVQVGNLTPQQRFAIELVLRPLDMKMRHARTKVLRAIIQETPHKLISPLLTNSTAFIYMKEASEKPLHERLTKFVAFLTQISPQIIPLAAKVDNFLLSMSEFSQWLANPEMSSLQRQVVSVLREQPLRLVNLLRKGSGPLDLCVMLSKQAEKLSKSASDVDAFTNSPPNPV